MEVFENDPTVRQGLSHKVKTPVCFVSLLFAFVPAQKARFISSQYYIPGCMEIPTIPRVGQSQNILVDVKAFSPG